MKYWTWGSVLILVLGWLGITPMPVQADTFVVDSNADDANAHDTNPGDGLCSDVFNRCTLRAAIEETNAHTGADTITFQSEMYIYIDQSEGALPSLTDYTTIDASNVWDSANDRPGVTLHGGGASFNGLNIEQLYCQVYGLFIINFSSAIYLRSNTATIGGTGAGQRNVLSSNPDGCGVCMAGSSASANTVEGNYIGLSYSGDSKQPNYYGVYIAEGASANKIRYNWISGNDYAGIYVLANDALNNEITGNTIGLGADNLTPLGNGRYGVLVQLADHTSVKNNLIAANGWQGVYLTEAVSTTIQSNTIYGNSKQGVLLSNGSRDSFIYDNTIFANLEHGIQIDGAGSFRNQIDANSIYNNGGKGIALTNGGNNNLPAPTILSASAFAASGTATADTAYVQVYSDAADEGETYEAMCIVDHTSGHQWQCTGVFSGPNLTALAFDGHGNTSEFSRPCSTNGCYRVYLPSVLRQH